MFFRNQGLYITHVMFYIQLFKTFSIILKLKNQAVICHAIRKKNKKVIVVTKSYKKGIHLFFTILTKLNILWDELVFKVLESKDSFQIPPNS